MQAHRDDGYAEGNSTVIKKGTDPFTRFPKGAEGAGGRTHLLFPQC